MQLSRNQAAQMGLETKQILQSGEYRDAQGRLHDIRATIDWARSQTRAYPPEWQVGPLPSARFTMQVEVTSETTLAAAQRLFEAGYNPVALNFGSARNPGGGFLSGARAQEESLCRSSALFACLEGQEYYTFHHRHRAPRYSSTMLYSPQVSVLRDETGKLIAPWPLAFITAAAPNISAGSIEEKELCHIFAERIHKIFSLSVQNGHDSPILGAWGCGVFGNDARLVAGVFSEVLRQFEGQFRRVAFAVYRDGKNPENLEAFQEQFAGR